MIYTMKFDLGGMEFTMSADVLEELREEYEHFGGSPESFLKRVEATVADIESGKADFRATVETAAEPRADGQRAGGSRSGWDDPAYSSRKPAEGSDPDDPWNSATPADRPSRGRSEPSRGNSDDEPYTKTDKFGRQWTLDLPDAPMCDCGEPAARLKAKARQSGKPYTVFKCAKGAPDGDWQSKCEFSEFPN